METDIHIIESELREHVENNSYSNAYSKEDSAYLGDMFEALFPDEVQQEAKHLAVSDFMDFIFNIPGGQSLGEYRSQVRDELKKLFFNRVGLPSSIDAHLPHWIKSIDYLAKMTPFGQNKPDNIHEVFAAVVDLKSALMVVVPGAKPKMTILEHLYMFSKASKEARLGFANKRSNVVKTYNRLNSGKAQGKDKTIGRKR